MSFLFHMVKPFALLCYSGLCSSGARSPQATNIWSWATEKEKQSPVRALRFRLLWKPKTKRANDLKRYGTKRKKLPHAPALPFAQKTKALIAQCNSISCVIYIRCTSSLFRFVGFTSGLQGWTLALTRSPRRVSKVSGERKSQFARPFGEWRFSSPRN